MQSFGGEERETTQVLVVSDSGKFEGVTVLTGYEGELESPRITNVLAGALVDGR